MCQAGAEDSGVCDGRMHIEGSVSVVLSLIKSCCLVAKVDELMALCDKLDAQLTTTQIESRRLLEAVLHEALALSV